MFVDDEDSLLSLIEMTFEEDVKKEGNQIFFATSGKDALEQLKAGSAYDISILVTDVNMPHMDGIELTKAVNKLYPGIQVFIMSAYDDDNTLSKVNELNIKHYFNKPIDFNLLAKTIKEEIHLS